MVRKIAINWLVIVCNYFPVTYVDLNYAWVGRQLLMKVLTGSHSNVSDF